MSNNPTLNLTDPEQFLSDLIENIGSHTCDCGQPCTRVCIHSPSGSDTSHIGATCDICAPDFFRKFGAANVCSVESCNAPGFNIVACSCCPSTMTLCRDHKRASVKTGNTFLANIAPN